MQTTGPTHSLAEPPLLGDHLGHPIYPLPAFVRVGSPDPRRLVDFVTATLDFDVVFVSRAPGPDGDPALIHLRRGRYQDVLVTPGQAAIADAGIQVVFAAVDADGVDRLAARVAAVDGTLASGPVETPWGTRDLAVRDPDGRTWAFTARSRTLGPMPGPR